MIRSQNYGGWGAFEIVGVYHVYPCAKHMRAVKGGNAPMSMVVQISAVTGVRTGRSHSSFALRHNMRSIIFFVLSRCTKHKTQRFILGHRLEEYFSHNKRAPDKKMGMPQQKKNRDTTRVACARRTHSSIAVCTHACYILFLLPGYLQIRRGRHKRGHELKSLQRIHHPYS